MQKSEPSAFGAGLGSSRRELMAAAVGNQWTVRLSSTGRYHPDPQKGDYRV